MFRRFATDAAIYGGGEFAARLVAFATFPLFAAALSVEAFGALELLNVTLALVVGLSNIGLGNATQRFYWDPRSDRSDQIRIVTAAVWLLLCSTLLLAVVATVLVVLFGTYFLNAYGLHWGWLALVFAAAVPLQLVQFAADVLNVRQQPGSYSAMVIARNLTGTLAALVFVVGLGLGVEGAAWGWLLGAVVLVPFAVHLIRSDLVSAFDWTWAKRLLVFGYPFIFTTLGFWLLGALDRWMLGVLGTMDQLGLYAVAFKFSTIIVFLGAAFGRAWNPIAMRLLREDLDYRSKFGSILTAWLASAALAAVALGLFARELLALLVPAEYEGAAPAIVLLAAAAALQTTTQVTAVGISIERRSGLLALGVWGTTAINAALNLALIPRFGATGAAVATLVSTAILTAGYLALTQRLHPIRIERGPLAVCIAGLLAGIALCLGLVEAEISLERSVLKFLGVAACAGAAWWVGVFRLGRRRALVEP